VTFHGRGGHGSAPHTAIDPVAIAARFIVDVQGVISREKDPTEFGVVTIGAIHGGTAGNIIPDSVQLSGTIRSFKPEVRAKMHAGIERTAKAAAAMSGAPAPDIKILAGRRRCVEGGTRRQVQGFAAGDRQRGFLRIRRRRRAVDDVQHRRL
jgi:hippurate hydrolase